MEALRGELVPGKISDEAIVYRPSPGLEWCFHWISASQDYCLL